MGDLDAREVLLYLNQLGYQNITAKQLKEFMKDLKKLMKYERKHKKDDDDYIAPSNFPLKCNQFQACNSAPISPSKPRESRKEQIICVKINRPTHSSQCKDKTIVDKCVNKGSDNSDMSSMPSCSEQKCPYDGVANTHSEETVTSKRPTSSDVNSLKFKVKFSAEKLLRPRSSFILPKPPIQIRRTDPVALYHKYQEEWKRQSIPGQNSYTNLRWAIREKMMGQEMLKRPQAMSAAPSMEEIARKRKTTRQNLN